MGLTAFLALIPQLLELLPIGTRGGDLLDEIVERLEGGIVPTQEERDAVAQEVATLTPIAAETRDRRNAKRKEIRDGFSEWDRRLAELNAA